MKRDALVAGGNRGGKDQLFETGPASARTIYIIEYVPWFPWKVCSRARFGDMDREKDHLEREVKLIGEAHRHRKLSIVNSFPDCFS